MNKKFFPILIFIFLLPNFCFAQWQFLGGALMFIGAPLIMPLIFLSVLAVLYIFVLLIKIPWLGGKVAWLLASITGAGLQAAEAFFHKVSAPGFIKHPYTKPDQNPILAVGLSQTQPLAILMWIFVFITSAILLALGIGEFQAKKIIVNLILAAALIYFMPFLCGIFIDATNVIMHHFLFPIKEKLHLFPFLEKYGAGDENKLKKEKEPAEVVALIVVSLACAVAFIMFGIIFLVRHVFLWILVILSPIAIVAWVFPELKEPGGRFISSIKGIWNWWEEQFFHWCIIGITVSFFLFLAAEIAHLSLETKELQFGTLKTPSFSQEKIIEKEKFSFSEFLDQFFQKLGISKVSGESKNSFPLSNSKERELLVFQKSSNERAKIISEGSHQLLAEVPPWFQGEIPPPPEIMEQATREAGEEEGEEGKGATPELTFLEVLLPTLLSLYLAYTLGLRTGAMLGGALMGGTAALASGIMTGIASAGMKRMGRATTGAIERRIAKSEWKERAERLATAQPPPTAGAGGKFTAWAKRKVGKALLPLTIWPEKRMQERIKEMEKLDVARQLAEFRSQKGIGKLEALLGMINSGNIKKAMDTTRFGANALSEEEVKSILVHLKRLTPESIPKVAVNFPQLVTTDEWKDAQLGSWKEILPKIGAEEISKMMPREFLKKPSNEFLSAMAERGSIEQLKAAIREGGKEFTDNFNKILTKLLAELETQGREPHLREINPHLAIEIESSPALKNTIISSPQVRIAKP